MSRILLQSPIGFGNASRDSYAAPPSSSDSYNSMAFTPAPLLFGAVAILLIGIFFALISCFTRCRALRDIQEHPVHLPPHELKIEDICPLPPVVTPPVLILQPGGEMALAAIQEGDEEEGGSTQEPREDGASSRSSIGRSSPGSILRGSPIPQSHVSFEARANIDPSVSGGDQFER